MDLLKNLNPIQREAVEYDSGPVLILAGAGSGKTRVLTHRIAYMIKEGGYSPDRILAVTFTNKAANEMKERIKVLLRSDSHDVEYPKGTRSSPLGGLWIGTFHSICLRILRKELSLLGLNGDFVIYDESDQLRVVKECLRELKLDEKYFNPRGIISSISRAKDKLLKPGDALGDSGNFFLDNVSKIYELYQEKLRINGAMDFGDLLFETVNILRNYPDVLKRYQKQFKEVLVDEFQDTNRAQYFLAKILTAENANLWVVGDEDQSIYSWRGAEVRNIVDLEKDYPDLKIFRLEQNYRSTGMILKAANSLVEKNRERLGKTLWTENTDGEKVAGYRFDNEHREAMTVGRKILDAVEAGKNYKDIAIFYRTNAQSRVIEEGFLRLGIPYAVISGVKFYERMEIKDILAYLRVLVNPNDSISLKRIINTPPRGIGKVTQDAISRLAVEEKIPFYHAIK
ncbi:MAG: UvrD-helicase domain-containing protein, partial [Thermodesulfobacteriota bacterium]